MACLKCGETQPRRAGMCSLSTQGPAPVGKERSPTRGARPALSTSGWHGGRSSRCDPQMLPCSQARAALLAVYRDWPRAGATVPCGAQLRAACKAWGSPSGFGASVKAPAPAGLVGDSACRLSFDFVTTWPSPPVWFFRVSLEESMLFSASGFSVLVGKFSPTPKFRKNFTMFSSFHR